MKKSIIVCDLCGKEILASAESGNVWFNRMTLERVLVNNYRGYGEKCTEINKKDLCDDCSNKVTINKN